MEADLDGTLKDYNAASGFAAIFLIFLLTKADDKAGKLHARLGMMPIIRTYGPTARNPQNLQNWGQ